VAGRHMPGRHSAPGVAVRAGNGARRRRVGLVVLGNRPRSPVGSPHLLWCRRREQGRVGRWTDLCPSAAFLASSMGAAADSLLRAPSSLEAQRGGRATSLELG
jgi:hypothetical protein